jgi:hypothetical protein
MRLAPVAAALALTCAGGARAAAWSEPVLVAAAPRPAETVAVRIAGREVAAAWKDYRVVGRGRATSTTDFTVWAAAGPLGGPLGPAQALDRGLGRDPLPALATSASGWAALAWTHEGQVRIALRAPAGAFGAPIAIPSTMVVGQLGVGIDDAGTATVAWSEFVFGADGPVRATTVPAGSAPAPVQTIGEAATASAVALAVDGRGDAAAGRGALGSTAQAALRPVGGAFAPPTTFGDPSAAVYVSGAAIAPDGRATLALLRHVSQPLGGGVGLAQGAPGAGWDAPQWLDPSAEVRNVTLAAEAGGARAAVWDTQPQYNPDRPGVVRVALAAPGQPFAVVAEEVERPTARSVRSAFDTTETANDAALTGGGETLTVWSGSAKGVSIHPLSAAGSRERIESLVDDACATGGAEIAAGPGAQAAALFLQPRGVWIAYRGAATPARPRRPRICSFAWVDATSAALRPRVRAGRVDLYVRVSKPIARVTVELRRGSTIAHRRLGPRPTGYVRVRLHGRGGAPRLSAGRYRVTVRAVDRDGRHAAARTVTLKVVSAPRVSSAG